MVAEAGSTPSFLFSFDGDDATPGPDRLSDRATDHLRTLIITLQVAPGSVIDEASLSQRLACGRTPLREALHRLAEERLVVILPRRAAAVAPITVTDLQQIFEVRLDLEGIAARLAARRASPAHLADLDQTVQALVPASGEVTALITVQYDFLFHAALARAADNQYLGDCVRRILGPAMRLTYLAYKHGQPRRETFDEHTGILRALTNHDAEAAEAAMRHHIARAKDRTLARL